MQALNTNCFIWKTLFLYGAFRKKLLTAVGNMILVIHLAILIFASKYVGGVTTTECENIVDVKGSLKLAEELIERARKNLPCDLKSFLPKDCEDLLNNGQKKSGVYLVRPINRIIPGPISVYCDMDTDGGGWTVIQRRGNFSREKDYFNQDWSAYKKGFGDLDEDFWLGNDYIYALSNQKLYSVRFDLGDVAGNKRYAVYDRFWIEEESSNYTLHATGYKGDAGDSLSSNNGCMFSTKDRDNDKTSGSCAIGRRGAWWYSKCGSSSLNGEYIPGKLDQKKEWEGLIWYHWKGQSESLATAEIKIRRNPSWVN